MSNDVCSPSEFMEDRKEYDDLKIRIVYDLEPYNPREDENLGTLVVCDKKYDYLEDKKPFLDKEKFINSLKNKYPFCNDDNLLYFIKKQNKEDLVNYLNKKSFLDKDDKNRLINFIKNSLTDFIKKENYVYSDVYIGDHGCVSLSTKGSFEQSEAGIIYVTPENFAKYFGEDTLENREKAKKTLDTEIEDLNAYVQGSVYKYIIEAPNGDIYASSGNFYDKNICIEEALDIYDSLCKNFESPESIKEFIKKDYKNYEYIPMECRTLEASKQYFEAGGDIDNIPNKYVESVRLIEENTPSMSM